MDLVLRCGHAAATVLLLLALSPARDRKLGRCTPILNAQSRPPDSPTRRISPIPTPPKKDSEEARNNPAPSPGCKVLSPFSRHSGAILRVVPPRNCSLLHTTANCVCDSSAPRWPSGKRPRARSAAALDSRPASPRNLGSSKPRSPGQRVIAQLCHHEIKPRPNITPGRGFVFPSLFPQNAPQSSNALSQKVRAT
jgi:hypothetical protein